MNMNLTDVLDRSTGAVRRTQSALRDRIESAEQDARSNPIKWAGIATSLGFTLGMIGRELRHRATRRSERFLPDLVIIEAA